MSRINLLTIRAFAPVLILFLSACAEEPLGDNDQTGKGHTITLQLSATVVPVPETKATVTPAHSGSEAETPGFKYEMVSSDAETVAATPGFDLEPMPPKEENADINFATKALATKAPSVLKNTYALLFTSDGAFNGRADIGAFAVETATHIDFVDVKTTTATNCRLVVVANDNAAPTSYASSGGTGGFANFSGTYADFQKLTITNGISGDKDVPYAGSAIISQSLSESGVTAEVTLSWTLAKITLNNHTFNITDGPARSSITLYNAGVRRFATQGSDNYNGTGNTQTADFVASTAGSNAPSVTWYVGENIRPAGSGINSASDRNSSKAPANACYIRIASAAQSVVNKSPKIGEEYIESGTKSFTYDYYLGNSSILTDFALRRHTDYTISTEINGTMAIQEEIAARDGRVTLTKTGGESAGLVVGRFGGPSGYTTSYLTSITGTYTKLLILEPNVSRTVTTDNIAKAWGATGIAYQKENRKCWDKDYIYSITTSGTAGGMNKEANGLYDYCYQLTLGNVSRGTWYVPTQAQLQAIWSMYGGMKDVNFINYTAFDTSNYWTSTEFGTKEAWMVSLNNGDTYFLNKTDNYKVRCVRDL